MILVDTTVWVELFGRGNQRLSDLLEHRRALLHPHVRGELSLGNLLRRASILADFDSLPRPPLADHDEVIGLIESAQLFGSGIGYVDAHLIASTLLMANGHLWTLDKRLAAVADRLGVAA